MNCIMNLKLHVLYTQNYLSYFNAITYISSLGRTYSFVAPWFLRSVYAIRCSMYSGILMYVIYNCMHLTEQQGQLELQCTCWLP